MTVPGKSSGESHQPKTTARREILRRAGRFVAASAPAVTLLLASGTKPAKAVGVSQVSSSRQFKIGEGAADSSAVLAAVECGGEAANVDPLYCVGACPSALQAPS